MTLANNIFDRFEKLGMDPWTDIHFVQLQTPDRLTHTHLLLFFLLYFIF